MLFDAVNMVALIYITWNFRDFAILEVAYFTTLFLPKHYILDHFNCTILLNKSFTSCFQIRPNSFRKPSLLQYVPLKQSSHKFFCFYFSILNTCSNHSLLMSRINRLQYLVLSNNVYHPCFGMVIKFFTFLKMEGHFT